MSSHVNEWIQVQMNLEIFYVSEKERGLGYIMVANWGKWRCSRVHSVPCLCWQFVEENSINFKPKVILLYRCPRDILPLKMFFNYRYFKAAFRFLLCVICYVKPRAKRALEGGGFPRPLQSPAQLGLARPLRRLPPVLALLPVWRALGGGGREVGKELVGSSVSGLCRGEDTQVKPTMTIFSHVH